MVIWIMNRIYSLLEMFIGKLPEERKQFYRKAFKKIVEEMAKEALREGIKNANRSNND